MKYLILIFLNCSILNYACTTSNLDSSKLKTSFEDYKLKGKVKQLTIIASDNYAILDEGKRYQIEEICYFDENGLEVRYQEKMEKFGVNQDIITRYNQQGFKIAEIRLNQSGDTLSRYLTDYDFETYSTKSYDLNMVNMNDTVYKIYNNFDDFRLMSRRDFYSESKLIYDDKSQLAKVLRYYEDTLANQLSYEYSDSSEIVIEYNSEDIAMNKVTYIFNESGHVIKEIHKELYGCIYETVIEYEYQYDRFSNWIERRNKKSGVIEKRIIEYY